MQCSRRCDLCKRFLPTNGGSARRGGTDCIETAELPEGKRRLAAPKIGAGSSSTKAHQMRLGLSLCDSGGSLVRSVETGAIKTLDTPFDPEATFRSPLHRGTGTIGMQGPFARTSQKSWRRNCIVQLEHRIMKPWVLSTILCRTPNKVTRLINSSSVSFVFLGSTHLLGMLDLFVALGH